MYKNFHKVHALCITPIDKSNDTRKTENIIHMYMKRYHTYLIPKDIKSKWKKIYLNYII